MQIKLDPMQGYVKDGKFDQKKALISTGVKAAICYKEAVDNVAVSPENVRESETDAILLDVSTDKIFIFFIPLSIYLSKLFYTIFHFKTRKSFAKSKTLLVITQNVTITPLA